MLVLRSSPASPFGRKVKIAASVLGLRDRIEIVATDTLNPEDSIRSQNPLGKIPTLILEDGDVLYDSRVIVEYLDYMAGGNRILPPAPARFEALKLQALADGISDAALLRVYEGRFRPPEKHEAKWVDHQTGKVDRGLGSLEKCPLPTITVLPDIGAIALACALGYLDLRAPDWRKSYSALPAWVDAFERAVPSFGETRAPA
ncbi:glutathione S-transferase family protein [Flaviflagellibacter deserti]|jgi:glutathione S-transferase|uniref:Glutathione S-transferase family protein n=1 Tax=Flaviflagellibacter deserti TaxID=2267266 RepID=A0ABV9YY64_9HYPH